MNLYQTSLRTAVLCTSLLLTALTSPAHASTWYVDIDTSSLAGSSGWIDFQFNPGDSSAALSSVTVSAVNWDSTSAVLPEQVLEGAVSGGLTSSIRLENSTQLNSWLQAFMFGSDLNFQLNFDDTAVTGASGSTFSLTLYDVAFNTLLADPLWNTTLALDLTASGDVQPLAVAPAIVTLTSVPLPGALGLYLSGLGLLGITARLRRPT